MVISVCKWFLLPVLLFINTGNSTFHPLYVSVTEIEHNAASASVQVSCKMFTDDVEAAINRLYKTHIDLMAPKDSVQAKKLLGDYITKHLQVKIDGKAASLQFAGFERENGAIWSYLEADKFATAKKVEVVNDLLYELFDSQMSIMHVTVGGKRKSTRLNNPDRNTVFEF